MDAKMAKIMGDYYFLHFGYISILILIVGCLINRLMP